MATKLLTDAYISINSSVLSAFATKIEVSAEVVELDTTTFGQTWTTVTGGLKKGTISIDFLNDYTVTTGLDGILWTLLGTSVTFEIRPTSSAASTSNPKWTGSVLISKMPVISGNVGDLSKMSVQWPVNGTLTRATA